MDTNDDSITSNKNASAFSIVRGEWLRIKNFVVEKTNNFDLVETKEWKITLLKDMFKKNTSLQTIHNSFFVQCMMYFFPWRFC